MRIAICDDNTEDISVVHDILKTNAITQSAEIDRYVSSNKLLERIKQGIKYDVVFLDVEMPELNGLELGKTIKSIFRDTYIVFVTNYPQFAIDAYDCEAFHYLLKPVDCEKARDIVEKTVKAYQERNKYRIVKIKSQLIKIPVKDIYYIECLKKHVIYHMKDCDHETVENISSVYNDLKDHGFYQVHQGYIVNMDKIKRFDKYNVILDDDRSVMVSVRKKTDAMSAFAKYAEVNI